MFEDYQRRPRTLWIAAIVFCVLVIADSWFRWSTFQYRTFDLAFYTHSFWLTLHGGSHSTILDVSIMGNHAEPICYLLLPFFWVWQHPMFFVVIQAAAIGTMPFTAYRIARRMEFSLRGATWLALSILIAPATGFMVLHEFHPETLAAPLILLMLEARLAQRVGSFLVWFVLSVACKENVALLLAWFCAIHYVIERGRGKEWQTFFNVIPGCIAGIWTILYVLWLGPLWNGGTVDYNELYSHIGGVGGILKSPGKAFEAGLSAATGGNLLWGLLIPFLLLPLLRPRWLVIALPILAQHLLSSRSSEWTIHFHYAAPLVPLMWFAAAEGCAGLYWRDVMAGWVLAGCIVCQVWFGPSTQLTKTVSTSAHALNHAKVRHEFIDSIPPEASVVAGLPYLSHLAKREKLYSLHHILKGLKTLSRASYVPPNATDMTFVDVADSATFDRGAGYYHPAMETVDKRVIPESEILLDQFLAQGEWRRISRNEVTLLIKGAPAETANASGGRRLDDFHTLIAAQFAPHPPGDHALILLTMEIAAGRKLAPWVTLYLRAEDGRDFRVVKGPIGLGVKTGAVSSEAWTIRRPRLIPAGKYRAYLVFHDNHEAIYSEKARFEKRSFDLGELQMP